MANHKSTPVAFEKYVAIANELGVPTEQKASWLKLSGPKGQYRVYVAVQKFVRRIDIAGFEVQFGAVKPHCGEFGSVKQQLDLDLPEEDILTNFRALLTHMMSLAPVEKPKKEAKSKAKSASSPEPTEAKTEGAVPADPREEATKRLAHIAKVKKMAESRGASVSPKLLAEEANLLATLTPVAQADVA